MHTLITHSCDNIFKYKLISNVDSQSKISHIKFPQSLHIMFFFFVFCTAYKTLLVRYVAEQF